MTNLLFFEQSLLELTFDLDIVFYKACRTHARPAIKLCGFN